MNTDLETNHRLKHISLLCIITSVAINLVVLFGWGTNYLLLSQFGHDYKPQPIITALMLLQLSGNLFVYVYKPRHIVIHLLIMISSLAVIFILTLILIDDFTGLYLNIEKWFILDNLVHSESRISPPMIVMGLLMNITFLLLFIYKEDGSRIKDTAAWLAFTMLVVISFILMGYLYNARLFMYTGGEQLTTVALPAAISFLFLCIGLTVAIGKDHLPLSAFMGPSLFSRLMRVTIPPVIVLIIFQNWINIIALPLHIQSWHPLTVAFFCIILALLISIFLFKVTLTISKDIDRSHEMLLQTQEKLRNSLFYNRGLIEATLDPLLTISKDGKITDVNHATEIVTGLPREQLIGSDFSNYFTEPKLAKKGYKTVLEKGFVENYELVIQDKSGNKKNVLYNAILYKDTGGNIAGIFAAARDITKRKLIEEEAKKYQADLERSNKELQQFAYIASHDLQEPLRVITSYLQLIERRYKDKLDQDANEFIDFAVNGANRLQQMITDLLSYSRVETRGNPFTKTDSNTVVKRALENLAILIEENHAVITYDNLPSLIIVDEEQLVIVFQNLLNNAIKFHKPNHPPKIHIFAEEQDTQWLFGVHDDGIGIDLQYKDKLFIIFKRLVGKEYSGSGMGLAICKRIVERHGGHIWVESKPEKGSTFYFTIPKEISTFYQ